jgi:hypothetical protein
MTNWIMTTITKKEMVSRREVEDALRFYVRFHLKPGDLDKVPELRQFINSKNGD